MTKFCESCHTPNKDSARYCRGCAGKFSEIRTPATAFNSTRRDPYLGKEHGREHRVQGQRCEGGQERDRRASLILLC